MNRRSPAQLPLDGLTALGGYDLVRPPGELMRLSDVIEAEDLDGPLCFALIREMDDVEVLARFTVKGEPVSKQRPRFSRGGNGNVYNTEGTKRAEQIMGWTFKQICQHPPDPTMGFGVYVGFFCHSGQRRDVDNLLKLVLDGLNGLAWVDDFQVTEVSAKVSRWQPDPRTEVVVYKTYQQNERLPRAAAYSTRSTRGGTCTVCGNKTSRKEYTRCGTCKAAKRT